MYKHLPYHESQTFNKFKATLGTRFLKKKKGASICNPWRNLSHTSVKNALEMFVN
jgi:hypothetical protein